MRENKRYYWLKLKDDFFQRKEIKKMRRVAGGDTYVAIYLEMMLKSLQNNCSLYYDGIEDSFVDELALELDRGVEDVQYTVMYLIRNNLLIEVSENEYLLPYASECTGSETASTIRSRRCRENQKVLLIPQEDKEEKEPKSNALRQRQFRAKKACEQVQHIPFIKDYTNNQRYNGNYYVVLKRDKYKCSICGSIERLCVHHIDGYDENKPSNSNENKLLTVCRKCHSNIHAGAEIPTDILNSIDYFDSNECCSNELCNATATQLQHDATNCNGEKREEKRKEKEIEKKKEKTLLEELIDNDDRISERVKESVRMWLAYKTERKERYKELGFKTTLTAIAKHCVSDGEDRVIDVIENSMANGWKGIIWDARISSGIKKDRMSVVTNWVSENGGGLFDN